MNGYTAMGIEDPFEHYDQQGVGVLMQRACEQVRCIKPTMRFSVCGEHAAIPEIAHLFHDMGIQTLSCAPCFVPRMRMAAGLIAERNS